MGLDNIPATAAGKDEGGKCLCKACNKESEFFGTRGKYTYYKCSVCNTLQLNPMPSKEELSLAYAKQYATAGHYNESYDTSLVRSGVFYEFLLKLIKTTKYPQGAVLDYGCGFGGFCALLKENNLDYLGMDLSEEMVAVCKSKGLNVRYGQIEDLPDQLSFPAMLMLFVFEHLTDYDQFIESFKKHISPGGIVIITIPTSPLVVFLGNILRMFQKSSMPAFNETLTPPWHTVIFSVSGMRYLMKRHNITIERVMLSPKTKGQGVLGIVKVILSAVEKVGFRIFGARFPLVTSHTFVCRVKK